MKKIVEVTLRYETWGQDGGAILKDVTEIVMGVRAAHAGADIVNVNIEGEDNDDDEDA